MKKMPTKRGFSKHNVTTDTLAFTLSFDNMQGERGLECWSALNHLMCKVLLPTCGWVWGLDQAAAAKHVAAARGRAGGRVGHSLCPSPHPGCDPGCARHLGLGWEAEHQLLLLLLCGPPFSRAHNTPTGPWCGLLAAPPRQLQ